MMGANDKILRPVHPNAGIEAQYRKKLKALIAAMQASIVNRLTAVYKNNEPLIAKDSMPADELQKAITQMADEWQARFDEGSHRLAEWFAQKTKNYADGTLHNILRDAGFTVEFRMTETMQDAYSAVIHEQVGLIKSIAAEHLQEVQGLVMRSVQQGRNLGELSAELQKRYGVTKRRAALIARDQNNKATAIITRVRQKNLGITHAVWKHSHAGKHPRPSHLAADGEVYEIDKGMYLDSKWVWPGTEIMCRCVSKPIIQGFID
jgi:SPP1 gp7 family putative phage head morphogenesis protein